MGVAAPGHRAGDPATPETSKASVAPDVYMAASDDELCDYRGSGNYTRGAIIE